MLVSSTAVNEEIEVKVKKLSKISGLLSWFTVFLLFGLFLIIAGVHPLAVADDSPAGEVDPALTQVVDKDEKIAPRGQAVEISAGHLDMGAKMHDGKMELMLRDDTTGTPIWRHISDVVVRVSDKGKLAVPAGKEYEFTKAQGEAWVIPQQQLDGVVWLGWNTQDPELLAVSKGGVNLIFGGHQGAGNFSAFVDAGNFSGPQKLWNAAEKKSQPVFIEPNTHTHVNWVFTDSGEHLLRLTAEASIGGKTVSDTQILHLAVGDKADGQKALAMQWEESGSLPAPEAASGAEAENSEFSSRFVLYIGVALLVLAGGVLGLALALRRRTAARQAEALHE